MTTETKIKVQWLANAVGMGTGSLSLGFCKMQPRRIAFCAPDEGMSALTPLIVRDLYVTARGCEEARRCLVLDCPLNKTTFTSYKNSASWKREGLPRKKNFDILLGRLKEWESMLKDEIARIDWNKDLMYAYPEPILVLRRAEQ
jgi:hypothetical protein